MTHPQRSQILRLANMRMQPDAIARTVGVSLESVERVLETERKRKESHRQRYGVVPPGGESGFEN